VARTTDIIIIKSIDQLPAVDEIKSISREKALKLVFKGNTNEQRKRIGQYFVDTLSGFQVLIHTINPELNIVTEREKVEIKSNLDLEKIFGKHIEEIKKKSKFNLWKFLSLKRCAWR